MLKNWNTNTANNKNQLINGNNENADVIWINLPYLDTQGDKSVLSLKRKITWCLTKKVKLKVTPSTQKLCFYTNTKDVINKLMMPCVAYQFCCPGCNSNYTGRTERNLCVRFNHISDCANWQYIKYLYYMENEPFDPYMYNINSIQKTQIHFTSYISNLVAKASDLNLGK